MKIEILGNIFFFAAAAAAGFERDYVWRARPPPVITRVCRRYRSRMLLPRDGVSRIRSIYRDDRRTDRWSTCVRRPRWRTSPCGTNIVRAMDNGGGARACISSDRHRSHRQAPRRRPHLATDSCPDGTPRRTSAFATYPAARPPARDRHFYTRHAAPRLLNSLPVPTPPTVCVTAVATPVPPTRTCFFVNFFWFLLFHSSSVIITLTYNNIRCTLRVHYIFGFGVRISALVGSETYV